MKKDTRFWFERQLKFFLKHTSFTDCPYYPCHKIPDNQDGLGCAFCYCPFYPCDKESRGGVRMDTGEGKIWDCSRCNFIHRFDVQARIIELFYKHKNLEEIERIIENEFESS